jgi:alkylation response protein AidB-like acyl-CoA dehydrogenase
VGGGYRVSGRWSFCSGIMHSDYLFGGCMVDPDDGNDPSPRILGIPVAQLEIVDTWHTSGLRGTGSRDAVADDVFVPARRSLWLLDPPTSEARLYRFPILAFFALSIAAAALGNARGAIADLKALAVDKVGTGSTRTLAQRPATWAAVAAAEASLRAARAFFYQAIDDAWAATSSPEPVSAQLRLGLRLSATHAVRTAADVARTMYDLGGGSAIYEESPLQRRFRDAHAATAHFQVNPATWELAGRLLLDQPTDAKML